MAAPAAPPSSLPFSRDSRNPNPIPNRSPSSLAFRPCRIPSLPHRRSSVAIRCRKELTRSLYTGIDNKHIFMSSKMVAEYSGLHVQPHKAIVGANAFAHESGIHQFGSTQFKISLGLRLPNGKFHVSRSNALVIKCDYPQNADLPRKYSKREKKPFPTPIVELRRAARERAKNAKGRPKKPVPPPKNGLLVHNLIPVAYEVYNSRISLLNNLKRLINVVPVHACRYCSEIHVGREGHGFRSCTGPGSAHRRGHHEWTNAKVDDVFLPVDAFHLYDRLGKRILHQERFSIPRVPAIVELCIQAGVDLPDLPTKRRRKPVIRVGRKEIIDADEDDLPDPEPDCREILTEMLDFEIVPPSNVEETCLLAEATLRSWDTLREGAKKLMRRYSVRVCGYCPEIHVGPTGHKAQNCGAYKHQQRNGQHGWQTAVLDDLIPPVFVWHVPDVNGPPLLRELRSFYGQAPAVVEMCVQAGAEVPEKYKSTMRLDIGIPSSVKEVEMVV